MKGRFHRPAIEYAMTNPAPTPLLEMDGLGPTILGRIAVGKRTHIDYEDRLMALRAFVKENGLQMKTPEQIEEALLLYMTDAFMDGRPVDHVTKLLAAFQWQNPSFSKHGESRLPRIRLALQGWGKGAPPRQRQPMARLEAAALANEMVRARSWAVAVCLLLMFDLYLRPGEAFSRLVGSAAPPVAEGGATTRHWSFTVRPYEEGVAAKTGSFDDSVVPDHLRRLFLGSLVAVLRMDRQPTELLFDGMDGRTFNKAFKEACHHLNVDLAPYQARHGGASSDRSGPWRRCANEVVGRRSHRHAGTKNTGNCRRSWRVTPRRCAPTWRTWRTTSRRS